MKTYKQFISEEFTIGTSLVGDKGERIHTKGGHIDVQYKDAKWSPRPHSIVDFVVDEHQRGQGIGKKLLAHAMSRHDNLGGQASSHASVKVMHNAGFRNPEIPNGSVEDHFAKMKEQSSVYMAHKDQHGNPYVK